MTALATIMGDSPGIRRLREQLEQILKRAATAPRPAPILLRGETGTGKATHRFVMPGGGEAASART